jgi:hypothetical protein
MQASAIQTAGILIKEFATSPSVTDAGGVTRMVGAPVLCGQHVACGPTPSVSSAFSQETQFIELTVGLHLDRNHAEEDRAIHYQLGNDPLPTLISLWQEGNLPAPTIPLANGARVVLPVGPGSRIAFLGANLGTHGTERHPPTPDFAKSA